MTDKRCCPTNDGPAKTPYTATGELIPGEGYLVGPANATAGIVVISDIFGMLPISMRFADTLAAAGYRVFMPDFFGEKAWSESNMPIDFESAEWGEFFKIAFNFDLHRPAAIAAVQRLRAGGCAKVATVGMCWGALLSFQLAGMEKMLDAVSSAHPSRLSAEAVQQSTVPICILNSKDEPPSEDIEAAMQKHTFAAKNVYHRYSTLSHGFFGARFDYDAATPEQVKEMDEALVKIKAFFQANLH